MNKHVQIAVVDDDQNILRALKRVFMDTEYQVKFFCSGSELLDVIESLSVEHWPDLILSDIRMPQMDGFETISRVFEFMDKELVGKEGSRSSVIYLTGSDDSDSILKGFKVGAVDYVTKPFLNEELLARVSTHMQLKRQRDQILEMSYEQKQLIRVLCHDLGNPIGAVRGILTDFDDAETLMSFRPLMKNAVDQCVGILEQIRRLHAATTGKVKLELQPVNISRIIEGAVELLGKRFEEKGVLLVFEPEKQFEVMADETTLYNSIVNNLLTNALKFSYRGDTCTIAINSDNEWVEVVFSDTGCGMEAEQLETLFDIHASTSHAGTEGETGTGFGMPLVKKFVTLFGGTIDVSSRSVKEFPDSHGTIITIRLRCSDGA